MSATRILMSPPDFFEVQKAINPWMEGVEPVNPIKAMAQWQQLRQTLELAGAEILTIPPVKGLPDLVFTANAAFVFQNQALIARYRHPERQPEEAVDAAWFTQHGFKVQHPPASLFFEGAGDALLWQTGQVQKSIKQPVCVFAGYGPRTTQASHQLLAETFALPVHSLELVSERFYHIDVCLCPLDTGELLYYPKAFSAQSLALLESIVPPDKRIVVSEPDAYAFGCNAVSLGKTVVFNSGAHGEGSLAQQLEARGYTVKLVDLSEFLKSGGSAKCLTLKLS